MVDGGGIVCWNEAERSRGKLMMGVILDSVCDIYWTIHVTTESPPVATIIDGADWREVCFLSRGRVLPQVGRAPFRSMIIHRTNCH